MDPIGILFAIMAAIFWGTYLVPVKTVRMGEGDFTLAMAAGVGVLTLAVSPWLVELAAEPGELLLAFLAGVIWSGGNICSLYAVRGLGLSRATPIIATEVILTTAYGILLFGELGWDTGAILMLCAGIAMILVGVVMAVSTYRDKAKGPGWVVSIAVLTAILFGTYNVPIKATTVGPDTATAGLFLGMVVTSAAIGLFVRIHQRRAATAAAAGAAGAAGDRNRTGMDRWGMLLAMSCGVTWGVGTAFSIYAIDLVGLALSFPFFLTNILIYVGWGLFYFKEVDMELRWRVVVGAIVLVLGATIVGFL